MLFDLCVKLHNNLIKKMFFFSLAAQLYSSRVAGVSLDDKHYALYLIIFVKKRIRLKLACILYGFVFTLKQI